jgi:hypothetical protein
MIALLLSGQHTTGQLMETLLQVTLVTKQKTKIQQVSYKIVILIVITISVMLYLGHGDGVPPLAEFLLQLSSEFFYNVRARKACDLLEIHCLCTNKKWHKQTSTL